MNKQYYSAQELEGLPGLAVTARGIRMTAGNENWTKRKKPKGKGFEYHISSLPIETQNHFSQLAAEEAANSVTESNNAIATRAVRVLAAQDTITAQTASKNRELVVSKIAHLTGENQKRAQSKLTILSLWQTFVKNSNENKTKASNTFLMCWSQGLLPVPEEDQWIKDYIKPNVSLQTLYRWEKALETNPNQIWGNYGQRKGSSKIDRQTDLKEFVIAMIAEYPHIYFTQLFQAITVRFSGKEIDLPSKRSLERWVNNYKKENAQTLAAITNPDKWKNKYMPAFGTVGVAALNEKWELDSTPADIMLKDGRYNLVGAIDVYSRRPKLLVSKTSTASAVAKLMRDCILDWGVPEKVKTDNGADYISVQIKTAFMALGIEQDISAPFSPWEKPHIERFFRTFSHGLLEIMPGFIGHNVAERSVIEDRKTFSERLFKKGSVIEIDMTSKDLQKFADDWVNNIYMHNHHTGDGINGKTPFQMVNEWPSKVKAIEDERALDILLAEAGERTVGKNGIRLDSFTYIAPELGAMATEKVSIRKDPIDVGTIHVFQNGKFICIAEDARFVGITRQEIAHTAKQNALKNINQAKKAIRGMKTRQKPKAIAQEILDHKREQNNITMLPKPTINYTNDNLKSASQAANMQHKQLNATPLRTAVTHVVTDPQETHRRFLRIEQKIIAEKSVTDQEYRFYNAYDGSSECTNMKEFFEDFGLGLETSSI